MTKPVACAVKLTCGDRQIERELPEHHEPQSTDGPA